MAQTALHRKANPIRNGNYVLTPSASRLATYLEVQHLGNEALERISMIYPEERSVIKDAAHENMAINGAKIAEDSSSPIPKRDASNAF